MAALFLLLLLACGDAEIPEPTSQPPVTQQPYPTLPTTTPTLPASPQPTSIPPEETHVPNADALLHAYASCDGRYQDEMYRQRYDAAQRSLTEASISSSELINETRLQCQRRDSAFTSTLTETNQPTLAPSHTFRLPTPEPTPTARPDPTRQESLLQQLTSITIATRALQLSASHLRTPSQQNPFVAYVMLQDQAQACADWAFKDIDPDRPHQNNDHHSILHEYAGPVALIYWCLDERASDVTSAAQWLRLSEDERLYRYQAILAHTFNYHRFKSDLADQDRTQRCRERFLQRSTAPSAIIVADLHQQDHRQLDRCFNPKPLAPS